jgi:hypothetical protein
VTDPLRKRRDVDEARRQREVDAGVPSGSQVDGSVGAVRSLQQTAGNAAVASLLGGSSGAVTTGPQRAPVKLGDELMKPGEESGTTAVATTASPAKAGTDSGATVQIPIAESAPKDEPGGFEAQLFEQTVLGPTRSLYAVLLDDAPDMELALERMRSILLALWDYQNRFEGKDDLLYSKLMAVRGWLNRPYEELQRRVGKVKPMSDRQIASAVSETIVDLNAIQDRLK